MEAIFEVKNQETTNKLIKKFRELVGDELGEEVNYIYLSNMKFRFFLKNFYQLLKKYSIEL